MFNSSDRTDGPGENHPGDFRLPTFEKGSFTHILLGDYKSVVAAIDRMGLLGYCDRTKWLKPIPTGRPGEYLSLMTRRNLPPGEASL